MTTPPPADPVVRPARGATRSRLSLVWLVPFLALAVSLGIAWQSYSERGVLIEIVFDSASGVVADKTELRYRDVTVGLVEDVRFTSDLSQVVAAVRIDKSLEPFLDSDAQFWVVRPEVSAQGISGLNTVLSGVYIQGQWDSEAGPGRSRFEGLDRAPAGTGDGTAIRLTARDGNSIVAGAPILYRGIPVGAVEAPQLSETENRVVINGFINAPYDRIVTEDTRFWDISGVSLSLNAAGVSLNFSSLASLVQGGISFDTLVAGGDDIGPDHTFPLYSDEEAARASLLNDPSAVRLRVMAVFDGAVGGLSEGATVRFGGLPVGEVDDVSMIAADVEGRKVVQLQAVLAIVPARLGLGEDAKAEAALDLLRTQVEAGMRVRLSTASMLSSELVVNLVQVEDAGEAAILVEPDRLPLLPTVEPDLADLNATAEGVFKRINNLPVEELMSSVQGLVESANALLSSEDTRAIAPGINATMADLRGLGPQLTDTLAEIRGLAPELTETLDATEDTLASYREIADGLQESGATEKVNNVFASASSAADAVERAAAELPQLTTRLQSLATRTEGVLQSYDDSSRLIAGALTTLRDVSEAADALRSLARTIQRNPNSLLIGR